MAVPLPEGRPGDAQEPLVFVAFAHQVSGNRQAHIANPPCDFAHIWLHRAFFTGQNVLGIRGFWTNLRITVCLTVPRQHAAETGVARRHQEH
jgi:hypothetical protein